jgi:glycosyltransferase involved in cell wall biosynthesis
LNPDVFEKAKDPIEYPWFSPGEPPVILGVGRLEEQKDFPNLIRAFAQVRKAYTARLVILGYGQDKQMLEDLVCELGLKEDVAFLGAVNNPYAYMSRSSLFVLSSKYEGLPTVLIEAMALGTPIVSTNCPNGSSDILKNGEYGELVNVGDSEALAEAILKALNDQRKQIPKSWLEQFTLSHVLPQYLEALGCRENSKVTETLLPS